MSVAVAVQPVQIAPGGSPCTVDVDIHADATVTLVLIAEILLMALMSSPISRANARHVTNELVAVPPCAPDKIRRRGNRGERVETRIARNRVDAGLLARHYVQLSHPAADECLDRAETSRIALGEWLNVIHNRLRCPHAEVDSRVVRSRRFRLSLVECSRGVITVFVEIGVA